MRPEVSVGRRLHDAAQAEAEEPDVVGQVGAEQGRRVLPEVRLGDAVGVARNGVVDRDPRSGDPGLSAPADHLSPQGVRGWQDADL